MNLYTLPARPPDLPGAGGTGARPLADGAPAGAASPVPLAGTRGAGGGGNVAGDPSAARGLPCPALDTALARLLTSARSRPDRLPLTRPPGGFARCGDPLLTGMLRCPDLAGAAAVLADVDKTFRRVRAADLPVWNDLDARAGATIGDELARELARERLDGAAPDRAPLERAYPGPRDVWSFFDPWSCDNTPTAATDLRAGLASAWLWGYVGGTLDRRAPAERALVVSAIAHRAGVAGDTQTAAHALAVTMRDGTPGPVRDALVWGWKTYGEADGRRAVATAERDEKAAPLVG